MTGAPAADRSVRVAVLDDYQAVAATSAPWPTLPEGVDVHYFHDHLTDEDAVAARLEGFEIVVAMRERTLFPASLLDRLASLRLLVTTGPFNAAIDVAAANERGVIVCGTGGLPQPTPELTWALILSLLRRVPADDRTVRAGGWQSGIGVGLHGKVLGLLGLGTVGSAVAKVGQAFGMRTIAWSQNLDPARAASLGVDAVDRATLLSSADVLTIHLVLSERTRGLVDAEALAAMKSTAYLVNTSRGPIVDEDALVAALRDGTIAGAGLDVFDVEPLPSEHPLRQLSNTVVTPHMGYVTRESYELFYGEVVEDIAAYLAGEPIRVIAPG